MSVHIVELEQTFILTHLVTSQIQFAKVRVDHTRQGLFLVNLLEQHLVPKHLGRIWIKYTSGRMVLVE